jgi:hypothetical protein
MTTHNNKPTVTLKVERLIENLAYIEWVITDELGKTKTDHTTCLATEIAETLISVLANINPNHDGGFYAQRLAKQITKGARTSACTLYLSNNSPKEKKAS